MRRSAAALLAVLLLGCPAERKQTRSKDAGRAERPGRTLTILATGDVGSDTDVCGCKARQMGGIARRARVVKERTTGRTIVVDAGDLFFRHWSISPRYEAQARATAEFLADATNLMDVPAVAVGERDLALGVSYLRKLGARAETALLSANLTFTDSGTAAFDAFTLVDRGGLKIGIIGLSPPIGDKAQAHLVYERNGLTATPVRPALEKASKAARKAGAEVVVALMHTGQQVAKEALDATPARTVDVAIVAHDRLSGRLALSHQGRSAWVAAGARGKWLVAVELRVFDGATGVMNAGALEAQKKTIETIDQRIAAYETGDAGAADPAVAEKVAADRKATVGRLKRRRARLVAELAQLDTAGKNLVSGELIPLDVSLPEDPKMLARYRAYQDRLFEVNSGVPPPDRAELRYTGNGGCKGCHAAAMKQWLTTKHAKAWETMVRTRQTGNLDCIPCHVTGFDRRGGPRSLHGLQKFADVGCESCHGPGSAHAKDPKVPMDYGRTVPEKVCAECHRAQEDQKPFNYEKRLPKVLGKGHGG